MKLNENWGIYTKINLWWSTEDAFFELFSVLLSPSLKNYHRVWLEFANSIFFTRVR